MADVEAIEIARYRDELQQELSRVMGKYLRILEWDVPDADEAKARKLVLGEMHKAIERMVAAG